MQHFPYPSPLGPPHRLAALLAPPTPDIGPIIAGASNVDIDGYILAGHRDERVGVWWNPLRSISTTLLSFLFGGGTSAFICAMVVGIGASEAGLRSAELEPLVMAAGAMGLVGGTLLALRFWFWLSFKRGGQNLFVGERGVSVLRGSTLDTTTFLYEDPDVFWASSRTRYLRRGERNPIGDLVSNAWFDGKGAKLYESRIMVHETSVPNGHLGARDAAARAGTGPPVARSDRAW